MNRSVGLWLLMGFAVTSLVGTLLHFMYEWLGGALWVAPFSGVNESTWEHMKLLFWPMLIFAVVQSFFFRDRADFWCITLRGILLGLILIPVIFYTYNGAFGESPDWLNIAIFFICAAIAYIYEYRMLRRDMSFCRSKKPSLALLFIIALMFVLFTFSPPPLEIFRDPTSDSFGI